MVGQEVVDAGHVDQPEAEHGHVGVGREDAGDAGGEGHGEVARDLHQAPAESEASQTTELRLTTLLRS